MIQIFASCNSRYFVLRRDNELSLYRVPARLWSRNIPGLQNIVGVGNRGDVFFRTLTNGLCRLNVNPDSDFEKVSWENVLLATNEGRGRVEKVVINSDGTEMFAEVNMPSQSLGNSWRNFFGPGERAQSSGYDHILYCIGDNGKKLYNLPRVTTVSAHGEFNWAVSRDFMYCVTALLQKRGLYEFTIYRIKRKEVIAAFILPDCMIMNMTIDDYGRVSVEVEDQRRKRMLIVRDTCDNCYNLPLQSDATVLNVWKDRACWKTPHEIAIQRLDGDMMCKVSTEPLNTFGVDYYFLFNHNNDINLALGTDEELIITPVNPDNLAQDAQRWTRVSELKRENEIRAEEQAKKEIEVKEAKEQRYQDLRSRLGSSLDNIKRQRRLQESQTSTELQVSKVDNGDDSVEIAAPEPMIPPRAPLSFNLKKEPRSQVEIIGEMKALRERYASGSVGRDEYMRKLEALNAELMHIE